MDSSDSSEPLEYSWSYQTHGFWVFLCPRSNAGYVNRIAWFYGTKGCHPEFFWSVHVVCNLLDMFLKCSMTSSEVSLQAQHLHRHRRVLQCCCYGHGTELWARGSLVVLVACFSKNACGVWTCSLDLLGRIDVTKRWFAAPNWSGHLMRSRLNIKTCNASMSLKKSCKEVDR